MFIIALIILMRQIAILAEGLAKTGARHVISGGKRTSAGFISFFAGGDKESDMQAAAAAGITRRFFIGKNPPSGAIACRSLARVSAFCIRTLTNS